MKVGVLWDEEVEWGRETPFDDEVVDSTLAAFTSEARKEDAEFYIAKFQWYGSGRLDRAFRWTGERWEKVHGVDIHAVFDKFKYTEKTRELKEEIQEELCILNDPELERLCKDKYMTYRRIPDRVPETREGTHENIEEMLEEHGEVVVKPRYAFGGKGIQIIENVEELDESGEEYVVQRFVDSSGGIPGMVDGTHDLRAIVINGEVSGAYLRYNPGSRLSNVSQGGEKEHVSLEEFPDDGMEVVGDVIEEMDEYEPAVYSVDLFYDSEGEPWVVELNSKPGFNFFDDPELERSARKMMGEIGATLRELAES